MIDMWKDEIGWLFYKVKEVVERSRESKLLLSFVFLEWSCLDWLIHNRCKALYSLYKLNKTKYIYFNILSQLTLFNFGGLMMEICWWLVCGLLVACWWIVLVACCLWSEWKTRILTLLLGALTHHSECSSKVLKFVPWKRLRENVSNLFVGSAMN